MIERPASVVKELLENSIDAGADEIEITVEKGGGRLIRVRDDGHGIPREQLQLALAPHATSKLYNQQELEQIASLGFRGEALASIVSVSQFRLASRVADAEQGWEISCGKGECDEPVPGTIPVGTQIEVRDLFHNIPARRKFLRSERTEFLHLQEVVRRLALSRFDIAFTLSHNGRQLLRLRCALDEAQQVNRVGQVLGSGFIENARPLHFEAAGLSLHGWLALPQGSRSQANSQYFYLNGRMIRDRLIQHAIRQAHHGLLEEGRHPAFVLFLQVEPRQVDINVHPTKHEVRFREPRLIHDFLHRALREALLDEGECASGAEPQRQPIFHKPTDTAVADQQAHYRQALQTEVSSNVEVRAILFQRYLLAGSGEEPQLLDLLMAHRYLLCSHLQALLGGAELRSQPLLIPQSREMGTKETERLLGSATSYAALGFELDRLGEGTVVLRRIPAILHGADAAALLQVLQQYAGRPVGAELLQQLAEQVPPPVESQAAAQGLLRQLEALPDPDEVKQFWRPLTVEALRKLFEGGR